jgi:hypothetical protein
MLKLPSDGHEVASICLNVPPDKPIASTAMPAHPEPQEALDQDL